MTDKSAQRPELDRLIRVGWPAGDSAAMIARAAGVTKNVVIGRARRLQMPARPSPLGANSPTRRYGFGQNPAKPKTTCPIQRRKQTNETHMAQPFRRSAILAGWIPASPPVEDPGQGCCFPMWQDTAKKPRPALYCGAARHDSAGVYCVGHRSVAYTSRASRIDPNSYKLEIT